MQESLASLSLSRHSLCGSVVTRHWAAVFLEPAAREVQQLTSVITRWWSLSWGTLRHTAGEGGWAGSRVRWLDTVVEGKKREEGKRRNMFPVATRIRFPDSAEFRTIAKSVSRSTSPSPDVF